MIPFDQLRKRPSLASAHSPAPLTAVSAVSVLLPRHTPASLISVESGEERAPSCSSTAASSSTSSSSLQTCSDILQDPPPECHRNVCRVSVDERRAKGARSTDAADEARGANSSSNCLLMNGGLGDLISRMIIVELSRVLEDSPNLGHNKRLLWRLRDVFICMPRAPAVSRGGGGSVGVDE